MSGVVITTSQLAALSEPMELSIRVQLREHLNETFPEVENFSSEWHVEALLEDAIARAEYYAYATLEGYCHFLNFLIIGGDDFDREYLSETSAEIGALLADNRTDGSQLSSVYRLLGEDESEDAP